MIHVLEALRARLSVVLALLIVASASGAAAAQSETPQQGGTLTLGVRSEIINVDGTKNGHSLLNGILGHVVETLVAKDESGEVVPLLATDWEVSADGTVWTFNLREGVTFHDGAPFNAEAVKKSFERFLSEEFNLDRGRFYSAITEIEVVEDYTVRFTTAEPWGTLLSYFTYIAAGIVSPNLADQRDFDHVVGTGPFALESWDPGNQTILVKNEDYWGEAAHLDRIVFLEVPEDSTRTAMLETGEIDVDLEAAPQLAQQFEGNPDFVVVSFPSERGLSLDLNVGRAPFDDVRVRRAVLHAINMEDIIGGVMFGQAAPLSAFPGCTEQVTGCIEIPDYHSYDPERARALLAEAGHADGVQATLVYGTPRYPRHTEILTAIQAQLAEVGIELKLVPLEWTTYLEEIGKPLAETSLDATSWAWSSVIGDISQGLNSRMLSANQPPNCCNVMFYENQRVDELILESDKTVDVAKRQGMLTEVQQILAEDLPMIYLLSYNIVAVHGADVHGIDFRADEEFSAAWAWKSDG